MHLLTCLVLGSLAVGSGSARADGPPVRIRMAAVAPDGTAWARELKATAREMTQASGGAVEVKWYLGAIAGDEVEVLERIRRGQLDGAAGASFCERLAPSLRVLRIPGLVHDREEGRHVIARLRKAYDEEFSRAGFVGLFVEPFGAEMLFSRTPIATMNDLKTHRVWVWGLAETLLAHLRQMGVNVVPLPLEEAARAFDEGRVDAFLGVPTAALAYQWIGRVRFFTPFQLALLPGCAIVSQRAFDSISLESQSALRTTVAKMAVRFDDVGRTQDEALLGRLLEKQGLKRVTVSDAFRNQFLEEAKRTRVKDPQVPAALVAQVEQWLAEYRAEPHSRAR
jgi:TRAP-type C4-dicarboxylate transport system substrate-binding protein